MIVSEIKLYELLEAKIGEQEAYALMEILENDLESKLSGRHFMVADTADISELCYKLFNRINEAKADIIKWRIATSIIIVFLIVAMLKFF